MEFMLETSNNDYDFTLYGGTIMIANNTIHLKDTIKKKLKVNMHLYRLQC